jgi:hypothetical protein
VNFGAVAALLKISAYLESWQSSAKPVLVPFQLTAMCGNELQLVAMQKFTMKWWSMLNKQAYTVRRDVLMGGVCRCGGM